MILQNFILIRRTNDYKKHSRASSEYNANYTSSVIKTKSIFYWFRTGISLSRTVNNKGQYTSYNN